MIQTDANEHGRKFRAHSPRYCNNSPRKRNVDVLSQLVQQNPRSTRVAVGRIVISFQHEAVGYVPLSSLMQAQFDIPLYGKQYTHPEEALKKSFLTINSKSCIVSADSLSMSPVRSFLRSVSDVVGPPRFRFFSPLSVANRFAGAS
jgi:hypothetical protein